MNYSSLYRILEIPGVYRLSQAILGPGAEKSLTKRLDELSQKLPEAKRILDVGCGPSSWLTKLDLHPVGLDISYKYSKAFRDSGSLATTGSAMELPFIDNSFDSVWSIGVLHHLPDVSAKVAIKEMLRVCHPDGYVIIMDAVLPHKAWKRPVATLIRRMDRGKYMRPQDHLNSLLPDMPNWHTCRYTYAATGLEMLECIFQKPLPLSRNT